MYNPFNKYDPEVVKFFNTITYLGGKRTANFIRGPMNVGDGRHSHLSHEQDKISTWVDHPNHLFKSPKQDTLRNPVSSSCYP